MYLIFLFISTMCTISTEYQLYIGFLHICYWVYFEGRFSFKYFALYHFPVLSLTKWISYHFLRQFLFTQFVHEHHKTIPNSSNNPLLATLLFFTPIQLFFPPLTFSYFDYKQVRCQVVDLLLTHLPYFQRLFHFSHFFLPFVISPPLIHFQKNPFLALSSNLSFYIKDNFWPSHVSPTPDRSLWLLPSYFRHTYFRHNPNLH